VGGAGGSPATSAPRRWVLVTNVRRSRFPARAAAGPEQTHHAALGRANDLHYLISDPLAIPRPIRLGGSAAPAVFGHLVTAAEAQAPRRWSRNSDLALGDFDFFRQPTAAKHRDRRAKRCFAQASMGVWSI